MDYRILGPLEVRDGGQPVDLGTPKQRSMLALLVLHAGTPVPADRLADLLWGGAPPARAEVSLRSYAANLRKALGRDDVLTSAGGGYRLAVADHDIDAHRFEAAVRTARERAATGDRVGAVAALDDALGLWHGPALADVATNPVASAEAARLEELRLAALEARFDLLVGGGPAAAAAAIPELERAVASHPLREGLRASLLRALHAAGRTAEALSAYRDLQERLAEEVGLDPSPQLRALADAIRDGTLVAAVADGRTPRLPLAGRRAELEVLRAARAAAGAGHGRVVVVEGDPGIGKTRLVTEAFHEAEDEGWVVATATCLATGDAPAFWPWAELLRRVDRALPLAPFVDARTADVLDLAPEIDHDGSRTAQPAALAPDAARFQRYDAVTTILVEASATRPIAIALDDLQWADPASLRLLSFLVGALPSASLLVAVTVRSDESDGPELRALLADLARSPAVVRLPVSGLDDEAVAALAAEAPPDVVSAIVDRAGGNPFFVTELLRLGPDALLADAVPAAVRDVVRQRAQRLSPGATKVLTTAAVIGREFDARTLAAVAGPDSDDAVEEAAAAHLVEETGPLGRYRFQHALVHEVLAEGVSGLRRARLHAAIARALDARSSTEDQRLAELARHLCAAAVTDPALASRAVEVTLDVGERTVRQLGYESAAVLYERALTQIDAGAVVDEAEHARLLVALAVARRAAGDPSASRAACLAAAEFAQKAGDAELLAESALGLALPGAVIGMDFGVLDDQRIELLERALELLPADDGSTRVRVLAHLALALYLSPQRARRDEVAAEAVAMARRLGSLALQAAALAARRSTLWGPMALSERIAVTEELVASADAGGAAQTALEGRIALAIDALEAADVDRFDAAVTTIDEQATALRQPFYAWYARVLEATKASLQARFEEAQVRASAAREVGGVALGRRAQWGQIGWQLVTSWDTGGIEGVEPSLRALHSAFPDNTLVQAALALVLTETGRAREALDLAQPLLDAPGTVPEDAMWSFTLTLLADVAWTAGAGDAGRGLAEVLAPAAGRLVVAGSGVACCGAADRAIGVARLAAGHLDVADAHLRRAQELHDRIGAPAWSARTEGAVADLAFRRGDAAGASARRDRARGVAEDLGAFGLAAALARIGPT